jgi:uncharacterized membrane protein
VEDTGVIRRWFLGVVLFAALVSGPVAAAQSGPVVHGVLFFSPSCGHCEYVINSVLPPLYEEHGGPWEVRYDESAEAAAFFLVTNGTLEFLLVDVSVEAGGALFQEATVAYSIESNGVPRMIIAEQVFIGSADIPEALPGLIDEGLAGDGIPWPAALDLDAALGTIPSGPPTTTTTTAPSSTTTGDPTTTVPGTTTPETSTTVPDTTPTTGSGGILPPGDGDSPADRFGRDAVANTIAVGVLVAMVVCLVLAIRWFGAGPPAGASSRPGIAIPLIAIAGIAVAAYLTYVESSGTEAVCGPVGDCNAVQQSEYAMLFGVIPIGLIGLVGYGVVLVAWALARSGRGRVADWAAVALLGGTLVGVAFSVYLTFLEPFVIGATCAWCLASAVTVTLLMLLSVPSATAAWARLRSPAPSG